MVRGNACFYFCIIYLFFSVKCKSYSHYVIVGMNLAIQALSLASLQACYCENERN